MPPMMPRTAARRIARPSPAAVELGAHEVEELGEEVGFFDEGLERATALAIKSAQPGRGAFDAFGIAGLEGGFFGGALRCSASAGDVALLVGH